MTAALPNTNEDALSETHVVTCFLRNRSAVLLLRRSEEVGSYQHRWGGVAGHVETDPDADARREIAEETGLEDAVSLARKGDPFAVEDEELGKRWVVHPYLFDCTRRDAALDWESTEAAWVSPTEILRRETVPQLWTSYEHVAPSVDGIRDDHEHGAAYLSIRALEVLRDRAALLAHREAEPQAAWEELAHLARALRAARPPMAVLRNRVNRVMHKSNSTPDAVERTAHTTIEAALDAEDEAAARTAEQVAGQRVLTLSRSGTVMTALQQADPPPMVCVATSWPMGESVGVAEVLAKAGLDVTLIPDAALAHALEARPVDLVLTGADTVLPDGTVVNKTGTHLAALVAQRAGVPFYATCTTDKVQTDEQVDLEHGPPAAVYDGSADLNVLNPIFERLPPDLVSGLLTERGMLPAEAVEEIAAELEVLADW